MGIVHPVEFLGRFALAGEIDQIRHSRLHTVSGFIVPDGGFNLRLLARLVGKLVIEFADEPESAAL